MVRLSCGVCILLLVPLCVFFICAKIALMFNVILTSLLFHELEPLSYSLCGSDFQFLFEFSCFRWAKWNEMFFIKLWHFISRESARF